MLSHEILEMGAHLLGPSVMGRREGGRARWREGGREGGREGRERGREQY